MVLPFKFFLVTIFIAYNNELELKRQDQWEKFKNEVSIRDTAKNTEAG
jgi:hypothetical protein